MTGKSGPGARGAASATLAAGRVGRPHGLDGSFYVTRPVARLLREGTVVTVGGDRRVAIARRAGTDARPIVRLEGFDGREAAEALRGAELTVDGVDAPPLEQGEFWAHELEGCAVVAGERTIGRVTGLLELPSCEVLEVTPDHGDAPVLVPMVRDAILAVDVNERRIEVDLEFLDLPT